MHNAKIAARIDELASERAKLHKEVFDIGAGNIVNENWLGWNVGANYEQELLGNMLLYEEAYSCCSTRIDRLKFQVFADKRHQEIYNIARQIVADGHKICVTLLCLYVDKLGKHQQIGGFEYLTNIFYRTCYTPNYKPLLDYLIELAYKRNIKL